MCLVLDLVLFCISRCNDGSDFYSCAIVSAFTLFCFSRRPINQWCQFIVKQRFVHARCCRLSISPECRKPADGARGFASGHRQGARTCRRYRHRCGNFGLRVLIVCCHNAIRIRICAAAGLAFCIYGAPVFRRSVGRAKAIFVPLFVMKSIDLRFSIITIILISWKSIISD